MREPPFQLNPYQFLHRSELYRLAWEVVKRLRDKRVRARREQAELEQKAEWVLLAYVQLSHDMDMVDARLDRGGFLSQVFMDHYLGEEQHLRYAVFSHAETLVRGPPKRYDRWALDTRVDRQSLSRHVRESPQGLLIALGVLERLQLNIQRREAGEITMR